MLRSKLAVQLQCQLLLTQVSLQTNGGQDAKTINVAQIDLVTLTAGVEELTLNVSGTAGDIDGRCCT